MTNGDLIKVLKTMDPKLKVFAEVTAANKSVQGVQVGKKNNRPAVILK